MVQCHLVDICERLVFFEFALFEALEEKPAALTRLESVVPIGFPSGFLAHNYSLKTWTLIFLVIYYPGQKKTNNRLVNIHEVDL